jgi:hypothetical protein
MNDTTNILEFPGRRINRNELSERSTVRQVPFRPLFDDISEIRPNREASVGHKGCREIIRLPSADYYSLTDRVEFFLFSSMSGAALVSLLLWILSLCHFEPTKSVPSVARPLPREESALLMQNRG